jgi:hypothetical protein
VLLSLYLSLVAPFLFRFCLLLHFVAKLIGVCSVFAHFLFLFRRLCSCCFLFVCSLLSFSFASTSSPSSSPSAVISASGQAFDGLHSASLFPLYLFLFVGRIGLFCDCVTFTSLSLPTEWRLRSRLSMECIRLRKRQVRKTELALLLAETPID